MESNWKFQRGDIYFVKLEAGVGSEQNGARPVVILQNDVGNIYSPTLIVAALTSKTDKKVTQATHCQVEEDGLKPSIVQAEQIFTIDKSRVLKFVGHLSPENMRRVDDAVKISLALNPMGSIQNSNRSSALRRLTRLLKWWMESHPSIPTHPSNHPLRTLGVWRR